MKGPKRSRGGCQELVGGGGGASSDGCTSWLGKLKVQPGAGWMASHPGRRPPEERNSV